MMTGRFRLTGVTEYRQASFGFDVRCPDYPGPLFGFFGDQLGEIVRCSRTCIVGPE